MSPVSVVLLLALFAAVVLAALRQQYQQLALPLLLLAAAGEIGLNPIAAYLIFPAVDLYLALLVIHRWKVTVSLALVTLTWSTSVATYSMWTAPVAHAVVALVTLGGLLRRSSTGQVEPEIAAATLLGCSDMAALYPLSREPGAWAETAGPQSLAVWTTLLALEIYWTSRRWPPAPVLWWLEEEGA